MVLQYLNMLVRGVAAIHVPFSAVYMFFNEIPVEVLPIDSAFSGKFKYLTFWTVCIEAAYFCFAVVENVVTRFSDNEKKPLRKIRDFWFMSIVLPLSTFVSFTFWGLFAINRELVMPKAFDKFFPWWLNHSVHTFVFIYSSLELLTTYHQTSSSIRKHCVGLCSITVPYLIWCNVVYWKSNMWVYPILAELNWPGRMLFFVGSLSVATGFCVAGCYVNSLVWKERIRPIGGKEKRK